MWPALVVPYAAAAVLLGVAGVPKVRDPGDLVRAVRSVGMPFGRRSVRAFAVAEVVVSVTALVVAVDPPGAGAWSALTDSGALAAVGFVALVALVGFLAWQVMAVLPTVQPSAIHSRTRGRV